MMENKLAGLLALLAFVILAGTWVLRTILGLPSMEPATVLFIGIVVVVMYYVFIGRMVAKVGTRLVEEELAELRSRQDEMRHRGRMASQELREAAGGEGSEAEGESADMTSETSQA